ncbi:hypothetical protein HK097_009538 [Rhizophlyctis rosea]|uniref:Chitin-binding type-1 domain-containing protein n=1 Tax=Rhizophlyctis rosea TaxID=64517 RepID=A0AAD5X588_9FUNG|nr:hypothetical protein HK097_009538 [Rhizophlyctis rosea]
MHLKTFTTLPVTLLLLSAINSIALQLRRTDIDWEHPHCGRQVNNDPTSNKTCPQNLCFSSHGYCGSTPEHCAAGCQSYFGRCDVGGASTPRKDDEDGSSPTPASENPTTPTTTTSKPSGTPTSLVSRKPSATPKSVTTTTAKGNKIGPTVLPIPKPCESGDMRCTYDLIVSVCTINGTWIEFDCPKGARCKEEYGEPRSDYVGCVSI